jgi:hypothetical protein
MRLCELIILLGILWDSDVFLHSEPKDFLINDIPAKTECDLLNNGDKIRFGCKKDYYWIIGVPDETNYETTGFYQNI